MAPQLAEAELVGPPVTHEAPALPTVGFASDLTDDEDRAAGRGIVIGILIASPLWLLIGFAIYLLL
jgi:hypothetical protein